MTVYQWVAGTPGDDGYGNEVPSFTRRTVRPLAEYPAGAAASSEKDTAATDRVTADLVLLLPPTVVVSALDEWTASDGLRYKADGEPGRYRSPFTGRAVTQVNLRRIT